MTFWTEPNGGVELSAAQLQPTVLNKSILNERNLVQSALSHCSWGQPITNVTNQGNWWALGNCDLAVVPGTGAVEGRSPYGDSVFSAAVISSYLLGGSYLGSVIGHELAPGTTEMPQLEAYPIDGAGYIYRTTSESSWTAYTTVAGLAGSAVSSTGTNSSRPVGVPFWVGGAGRVRLTPYAKQEGGMSLIVGSGAGVTTALYVIDLPNAFSPSTWGWPKGVSFATNGAGKVLVVSSGIYVSGAPVTMNYVWVGTSYGVTAGNWTRVLLPANLVTNGYYGRVLSVTYDATRSLFVLMLKDGWETGSETSSAACWYTTSPDGMTWQNWRRLPFVAALPGTDRQNAAIACTGGIWLVSLEELVCPNPSFAANSQGAISLWASIDAGASWFRVGNMGQSGGYGGYTSRVEFSKGRSGETLLKLTGSTLKIASVGAFDALPFLPSSAT